MSAARVVLWRHGQTDFNTTGRFQGHSDTHLDELGRRQVEVAAPLLARLAPDRIVSSDLSRAVESAQVLADLVGLDVVTDDGLRETAYGRWEGLTAREVEAQHPEELARWSSGIDDPTHGGESRIDSAHRTAEALRRHIDATTGTLVVVGHGGSMRGAVCELLGLPVDSWDSFAVLNNAHWLTLERRRGGLTLVQYNAPS